MFSYEYNTPIRFNGDIIITDPCYIINKDNTKKEKYPSWWDFLSKSYKKEDGTYYIPKPEDYPDARPKTVEDYMVEANDDNIKMAQIAMKINLTFDRQPLFSDILQEEWNKYREAEKEYLSRPHDDWEVCNYGKSLENLGFSTFLATPTIYGDWDCNIFNSDTEERIGQFCADSAQVGVFLLEEVLKYNPHFDYYLTRPWTTTYISNFHGEIQIQKRNEVKVIGKGNVNFISKQCGL